MSVLTRSVAVVMAVLFCRAAHASLLASANVMAPLDLDGGSAGAWDAFNNQLKIAKSMGVNAVAVDVWWGKVEKTGDNVFDWSYYDRLENAIEMAGLHWVPIMSFHQCGGNVGDVCRVPIPSWIWDRNKDQGVTKQDLQYKSERDNSSTEVVSLWQDRLIILQFQEFMTAFAEHFGTKADITDEIDLSMGPAGELRYPSYDAHDGQPCGFPTRGCFQAYITPARADFRAYVLEKYHNLAGVNESWKNSLGSSPLTDVSQIGPPDDGDPSNGRASAFMSRNDHINTQYGRDFIDWYNQSLVNHGRRMLDAAIVTFGAGPFKDKPIGVKMAGVHWQMMDNADHPRAAELTAGLIQNQSHQPQGGSNCIRVPEYLEYDRFLPRACEH
jgi:beta-amylase